MCFLIQSSIHPKKLKPMRIHILEERGRTWSLLATHITTRQKYHTMYNDYTKSIANNGQSSSSLNFLYSSYTVYSICVGHSSVHLYTCVCVCASILLYFMFPLVLDFGSLTSFSMQHSFLVE